MSVAAEHEELKSAGFNEMQDDFIESDHYARWHLLNQLAREAEEGKFSPNQAKLLLETVFENLLKGGKGNLEKQFRYGRRVAKLLKKNRQGELPDFGSVKLRSYRLNEVWRKTNFSLMGTAAALAGMKIFFDDTLGDFIAFFSNGWVIEGNIPN